MSIQLHRTVVTPRRLSVMGAFLLMATVLVLALFPWHAEVTVRMSIPARMLSALQSGVIPTPQERVE